MARPVKMQDTAAERRIVASRGIIAVGAMVLLFTLLIARLAYLQIYSHEHYATLSQDNRVRIQPIAPTRGLIFDRNGVLLAENLPSYRLDVIPEEVDDLDDTLARLKQVVNLSDDEITRFQQQLKRHRVFDSVPLRYRMSEEELARFAVDRIHFPGVEMRADLTRHYVYGQSTAHVIGYVGAIDEDDLKEMDRAAYRGTTHIGKTGVEQFYERALHGSPGYEQAEVDAQGRPLRSLTIEPQVPGKNLHLSIDIQLQRAAEAALKGRRGAVVAIEPSTGEVLAMASVPSYDANLFVGGISVSTYRQLQSDPGRPLFNRAIQGQYPPGSTVKPFLGLADLDIGHPLGGKGVYCPGHFQLPNTERQYRDWKRWGHGQTNLRKAIAESCDVYFYQLSLELGIDRIHDYLTRFGMGDKTGIDLTGERRGLVPSREWKQQSRGESWYLGETLINSIGQGFMLSTPLQLAQATAILSTRGKSALPRLVREIQDPVAGTRESLTPVAGPSVEVNSANHWDYVINAMNDVVQRQSGTAFSSGGDAPYRYAGKTGTAQVFGLGEDEEYEESEVAAHLRDHALFIAFAPLDDPKIALAIVAEHGGSGGRTAAPVARALLDSYLLRELDSP
ncbi:MAG: penicillin-binding protein 2 [Pseudomonadota bacterium]|nr:penicillin-binding protein 2 [Pseudomonadota bacterium]